MYSSAAVVIPAHNEAANLPRCLKAVLTAAVAAPVPVTVTVVLDATDDRSERLAGRFGPDIHFVSVDAGNVGAARASGFGFARRLCGADNPAWYATTDADSVVDPAWLIRQLEAARAGADMVLGVVRVSDWRALPAAAVRCYLDRYQARSGSAGHDHVHGANMGFRAEAYWRVGGFRALPTDEDVELVARFDAAGYRVHRDPALSVTTSARLRGRAPSGFAAHLLELSRSHEKSLLARDSA